MQNCDVLLAHNIHSPLSLLCLASANPLALLLFSRALYTYDDDSDNLKLAASGSEYSLTAVAVTSLHRANQMSLCFFRPDSLQCPHVLLSRKNKFFPLSSDGWNRIGMDGVSLGTCVVIVFCGRARSRRPRERESMFSFTACFFPV